MTKREKALERIVTAYLDRPRAQRWTLAAEARAALALPKEDAWLDPEEPPKMSCEIVMEITKGDEVQAAPGIYGIHMDFRFTNLRPVEERGWVVTGYQHLPKPRAKE